MTVRWYHWLISLVTGVLVHAGLLAGLAFEAGIDVARAPGPQVIVLGTVQDTNAAAPDVTAPGPPITKTLQKKPALPTVTPLVTPNDAPKPAPAVTRPPEKSAAPVIKRKAPALQPAAAKTAKPKKPARTRARARRRGREKARRSARLSRSGAQGVRFNSSPDGRAAISSYRGRVLRHLQRQKRFPEAALRAGLTGTAVLIFSIVRSGRVTAHRLVKGSGHRVLDREVRRMVKAASPFPGIPDAIGRNRMRFRVPVKFLFN